MLADARHDRRLQRDGFVKVRMLDEGAAQDLREAYGQLHGWAGTGFEVDFWSRDPAYRRAIAEVLANGTDDAVEATFADHRSFLRNYLVKWPDEPVGHFPQEPHRDWWYTDERAGDDCCIAWIALEDITGDNGQLRVARSSHRIDQMARGTNIVTPWLRHREVWDDRMVSVPVRAGEAVIMSPSVVHCSFPNFTSRPRVAVAIVVHRRGAPLLHLRGDGSEEAAVYEVDDEFFTSADPIAMASTPLDRPVADRIPIGCEDMEADELARCLDRRPLVRLDRRRIARARKRAATSR